MSPSVFSLFAFGPIYQKAKVKIKIKIEIKVQVEVQS